MTSSLSVAADALANPDVLLTLSGVSSLLFWVNVRRRPSLPRTVAKTASTALLAAFSASRQTSSTLLPLALALGSAGDAFLAWSDGDGAFLGGLASFLAAHVAYARLFVGGGGGTDLLLGETWRVSLAGVMALVGPAFNAVLLPRVGSGLRAPVIVYSAAITAMFVSALTVSNQQVVTGALLFTASDIILASEKFIVPAGSVHKPWMQYAVWGLYYSGQLLIALGSTE